MIGRRQNDVDNDVTGCNVWNFSFSGGSKAGTAVQLQVVQVAFCVGHTLIRHIYIITAFFIFSFYATLRTMSF